jgi:hypothetical protein
MGGHKGKLYDFLHLADTRPADLIIISSLNKNMALETLLLEIWLNI